MKTTPTILLSVLLFLQGCSPSSSGRQAEVIDLGAPPTENSDGQPIFLGDMGSQVPVWIDWRHRWLVDLKSPRQHFTKQSTSNETFIAPAGPGGGAHLMPNNPAAEKIGEAREGHVLSFAARNGSVVGVVEERRGRISLAWTRDDGTSIQHEDLGSNDVREPHDGYQTLRQLGRTMVCLNAEGIAAALLIWHHDLITDSTLANRVTVTKPSWTEVEVVLLKKDHVERFPLKSWNDSELAVQVDLVDGKDCFWAAILGRRLSVWSFTMDGLHESLSSVAGSGHSSRGTVFSPHLVPKDSGVLVAWVDKRNAHSVGIPGPWMRKVSAHSQVAVCEIQDNRPGRTELLTPKTHSAGYLQAGLTADGPCLLWTLSAVDNTDPTALDKNIPPRLQALLIKKAKK